MAPYGQSTGRAGTATCAGCRRSNVCLLHAERPALSDAGRLVGVGMRCWLAGFDTGSIASWENGFDIYRRHLGREKAGAVVGDLSCWVRDLRETAGREISYYPFFFPLAKLVFTEDEMAGIRLICACQMEAEDDCEARARELTGHGDNDRVTESAHVLAATLRTAGLNLDH